MEPLTKVRLRPLVMRDASAVAAAQHAMAAEDFTFALRWRETLAWDDYLGRLDRIRRDIEVPDGLVPADFLVAEVDGRIVGRSSIRHRLNDLLAHEGGHIGYCVLPAHRRRGFATEILRQSLIIARAAGVDRVLVACDDDNEASGVIIERCGGVLEDVVQSRDDVPVPVRRYWIA